MGRVIIYSLLSCRIRLDTVHCTHVVLMERQQLKQQHHPRENMKIQWYYYHSYGSHWTMHLSSHLIHYHKWSYTIKERFIDMLYSIRYCTHTVPIDRQQSQQQQPREKRKIQWYYHLYRSRQRIHNLSLPAYTSSSSSRSLTNSLLLFRRTCQHNHI